MSHRSPNRTRLEGAIKLRGQEFPFVLLRQELDLGCAGTVPYYYMQPSGFRRLATDDDAALNFRSGVGHFGALFCGDGANSDWEQLRHFVLAVAYSLVCDSKALQDMYLDAYLKPGGIDASAAAREVTERIQKQRIDPLVKAHDAVAVKAELDRALGAYRPNPEDLRGFEEAFGNWADKGVNLYLQQGQEGIERWLGELEYWLDKYRKRSAPRVRRFINFFAYQTKSSFHLCYANFWVSLLAWLREHETPGELSERFIRIWHCQNQPVEVPCGQTAGGVYYPTGGKAQLLLPNEAGSQQLHSLSWQTPRIGPEVVPDIFSGQVLGLHPLSWFLLNDPRLRDVVGTLIGYADFERVMAGGGRQHSGLYWDFVGAVLTAAHQYRVAREQFESSRRERLRSATNKAVFPVPASSPTEAEIAARLHDFVADSKSACQCGELLAFDSLHMDSGDNPPAGPQMQLACPSCGRHTVVPIPEDAFRRFLVAADE